MSRDNTKVGADRSVMAASGWTGPIAGREGEWAMNEAGDLVRVDVPRLFKSPLEAEPGDPCGLLYAIGPDGRSAICDGTLDCYVDVHGKVPGCECHLNPPCGACLDAPLACATCLETVP